jgi:anti-sigma B factor antagonist
MEVTTTEYENCDLVVVSGRVDSYTAPDLSEELNSITFNNRYNIVLDMENVSYVSSAGLRVLIDIQKTCKKSGDGEAILVSVPDRVFETLELAGFTPLFNFYDDVSLAINQF